MPNKPAKVVSIAAGDHRARVLAKRDKLIAENFHLVRPIAERIMLRLPPSFELDDLVQNGQVGLLHAATCYRPGAHGGAPFSAYARIRIRGTIIDSIRRRHYVENTRVAIDEAHEQHTPESPIEICIDRRRLVKRVAIERQYLSDEQSAVMSAYYSVNMPSLATVAAQLGLPERRAVRAHTDALAILRKVLKVA